VQERYPSLSPDGQMVVSGQEVDVGPAQRSGSLPTRTRAWRPTTLALRIRQRDGTWGPARHIHPGTGGAATFGPEGTRILFTDFIGGTAAVIDTAGHELATFHGPRGGNVVNARWAPDGTHVVFKTRGADGTQAIWLAAAAGGAPRQIVRVDDVSHPWLRDEFATDGRFIYLVLSEHESDIWAMDLFLEGHAPGARD